MQVKWLHDRCNLYILALHKKHMKPVPGKKKTRKGRTRPRIVVCRVNASKIFCGSTSSSSPVISAFNSCQTKEKTKESGDSPYFPLLRTSDRARSPLLPARTSADTQSPP